MTPRQRADHLAECQGIRAGFDGLASGFPRTTGLGDGVHDLLAQVLDMASADVARLERSEEVAALAWKPSAPRPKRAGDYRKMTRSEWTAWGARVCSLRTEMRRLSLAEARLGVPASRRVFVEVIVAYQLPVFLLDSALRSQHPDWSEGWHVFYPPEPEKRKPAGKAKGATP